ncbi:3-deoxy-7-phosphoheptulonate synthase [Streptomyces albireticuli]|uniref:Phospho-2-dehydro-3-deoxyheptonate aldolase n=1 Tax=Streptomyces albireticuli TaxID=1940 RepID=A0A2A2D3X6_9ACTN|nr:3-deoxy-7-phosphoheptulonate synthase [Streptomyces albireticuli]MCD9142932.1 3-deoxy-7-phosphoheptulonate synthase [Streptomyces albireticuli]MCD9162749.1 3-deoxy-7-phosphoheptulonate synthase [Streptomyces albireticuli]MCD9192309.1 3-deoxy-7-phosphoheptulonate synthase [Streptomyces albireticuli]PAU46030.1 phospho-2-dehydro-3-deoxyheptonate aldolase [Streptomyces albireticuli]
MNDSLAVAGAPAPAVWDLLPAEQQPRWSAHPDLPGVRRALQDAPALTTAADVRTLRRQLAEVALGRARLLQSGDCAEDIRERGPAHTAAKAELLAGLADRMALRTGRPVVRVGRMGGQFAKPRSSPTETHDGVDLPVFRGHLVNSPEPHPAARRHDPNRMLQAYEASAAVLRALDDRRTDAYGPWASHEALVMDYESPQVRRDPETGAPYLASTHFPWIGERTRQLGLAHVEFLASLANPVACKIGPSASAEQVVRLCRVLDPDRLPGRLTLILRTGVRTPASAVTPVVEAVQRAGHPVVWLSDPLHGNTVQTSTGLKTRRLADAVGEAVAFRRVLEQQGLHPGGLHLETAAADVTECLGGPVADEHALSGRYESLCDPRLNPAQARELIDAVFS